MEELVNNEGGKVSLSLGSHHDAGRAGAHSHHCPFGDPMLPSRHHSIKVQQGSLSEETDSLNSQGSLYLGCLKSISA